MSAKESVSAMLVSPWIDFNSTLKNSNMTNIIEINLSGSDTFIDVNANVIILYDGNTKSNSAINLVINKSTNITIDIPTDVKTAFKVILEITLTNNNNNKQDGNVTVSVDKVILGDICANTDTCNKRGKCLTGKELGSFQCTCDGQWSGDRCQFSKCQV